MRALLLAALFLATSLAGCGGKDTPGVGGTGTEEPLAPDKGAIAGLVIDDVYRPVPQALVLLEKLGLTATTDATGQFSFTGLEPGAYILKVQADGHAAAPKTVDVVVGQYAEAEIQADRLFNEGSRIVTAEYSIFTSCATATPAAAFTYSCLLDPDSYRPGLSDLNYSALQNVTYLVAEVLVNQPDNYDFVLRHDDGSSFGGDEYGSARLHGEAYGKVILKLGENYLNETQPTNTPWLNDKPLAALLFYLGTGGEELEGGVCTVPDQTVPGTPVTNPIHTCDDYFGAGQKFAIQGRIVLSVFLGEPDIPVEDYQTLKPSS